MAGLAWRLLLCLGCALAAPDLVLEEAKRTVDLSTHLAKVSAELNLANPAGSAGSAGAFLLALEPGLEPRLAYLGVQVRGRRGVVGGARPQGHVSARGGGGAGPPDPAGVPRRAHAPGKPGVPRRAHATAERFPPPRL